MTRFLGNYKVLLPVISFILILIPFFWLKQGEMDLGGDGSRLYFYDPLNYFKSSVLYAIQPGGMGRENPLYFFLPFNLILIVLIKILKSSYLMITLFNGFHLLVAFWSMYGITKELLVKNLKKSWVFWGELSAIFAGLYYIFSPIMVRSAWDKALFTHAQIFLNPLIFYLLLRFFLTNRFFYLLLVLLTTFIFSTNFSWAAAPPLFGFYPLAVAYLLIYIKFVKRLVIRLKPLFMVFILFLLLHAFHLFPLISNLLNKSSLAYEKIITNSGSFNAGLAYFLETSRGITLRQNLLGFLQAPRETFAFAYEPLFFVFPCLVIIGLLLNYRSQKWERVLSLNYLLLLGFFLISVFWVTARITQIGFEVYKNLFNFSVFSMFRNYYGQWVFVYLFFLSLLLGQALFYFLRFIKKRVFGLMFYLGLVLLVIVPAFPFIKGEMISLVWNKGEKVEYKIPIKMDPEFEKALQYIRDNPLDGKYLTLPLTESFNQILRGTQNGIYLGPSMISLLTGKSDFDGYQTLFPFSQTLLDLVKEKDYRTIENLLSILNIKYLFYNSDEDIHKYFPHFPFEHVRNYLLDNKSYTEFLSGLNLTKKADFGDKYHLYELNDNVFLPHLYLAKKTVFYNKKDYFININNVDYTTKAFFKNISNYERRTVYLENNIISDMVTEETPQISITKINPTRYIIEIRGAEKPYLLVFSEAFNRNWKLFIAKEDQIAEDKHVLANAYANAWYIEPGDAKNKVDYTIILELVSQRVLYPSLIISFSTFAICLIWLIVLLSKKFKS